MCPHFVLSLNDLDQHFLDNHYNSNIILRVADETDVYFCRHCRCYFYGLRKICMHVYTTPQLGKGIDTKRNGTLLKRRK